MLDQTQESKGKVPLTSYDIFGYLVPGANFLLSIFLFEFWISRNLTSITKSSGIYFHTPFYTAMTSTISNSKDINYVFVTIYIMVLLAIAYTTGHIVSSISSFFIDRTLIAKGYDYPYTYLLNLNHKTKSQEFSRSHYRGTMFWINMFVLIIYISTFLLPYDLTYLKYFILFILIITLLLKIIISGIVYSHNKINKTDWFDLPLQKEKDNNKFSYYTLFAFKWSVINYFKYIYAGLYDLIADLLAKFINTKNNMPDEFIKDYIKYFKSNFNYKPEEAKTNNYWFPRMYIMENSPKLDGLLNNWHHMYSFARNLSASFFIAFIYCFISLYSQNSNNLDFSNDASAKVILYLPLLYFFLSVIMVTRFYFMYVSYYSKFLFRSFVYLNIAQEKSEKHLKQATTVN